MLCSFNRFKILARETSGLGRITSVDLLVSRSMPETVPSDKVAVDDFIGMIYTVYTVYSS